MEDVPFLCRMCKKKKKTSLLSFHKAIFVTPAAETFSCLSIKLQINQVVQTERRKETRQRQKDSEIVREDSKTVRGEVNFPR